MKKSILSLFLLIGLYINGLLNAQCTPAGALTCQDAAIHCALDDLNGLVCQVPLANDGFICDFSGSRYSNVRWWAYYPNNENQSITITPLSNCNSGTNLYIKIYEDCNCKPASSFEIGNQAKTFNILGECNNIRYLSIEGNTGSSCQYSIAVSNGKPPTMIGTLSNISDDADGIIELCPNSNCYKYYYFYSHYTPNLYCNINNYWTLDGVYMPNGLEGITINFPKEGEYQLCVFAYVGDKKNGTFCYSTPTKCATVKIKKPDARVSNIRYICKYNLPYKWGSLKIVEDGIYTQKFKLECCEYDSIIEVKIVGPESKNVYHLSCDGTIYVDPITDILYPECFSSQKIVVPLDKNYGCDNSYYLSTSYPKIKPQWIINNVNGVYEIDPNITIKDLCDAQIDNESYSWFKNSDPNHTIISTAKKLTVNAKEDYCLNYSAFIKLGTSNANCLLTFCEPFTQVPTADFLSATTNICPGKNVKFEEKASTDVMFWEWEFPGAEPSSSSLRNPTVYYDKPGIYPVKLIVENKYFKASITKTGYIKVVKTFICGPKERKKIRIPIGGGFQDESLDSRSNARNQIQIIPNPNNGQFIIEGLDKNQQDVSVEIFNLIGEKVFIKKIDPSNTKLEIKGLDTGSYFISIQTADEIVVRKVMIVNNY